MDFENSKTIAQHIGREGERRAAAWLWLKGFDIVEKNCRVGRYEVDLVCRQGPDWVFVEVKTRTDPWGASPENAVDYKKRHHLQNAAKGYLKKTGIDCLPRVDIVAVSLMSHGTQMMYFQGK